MARTRSTLQSNTSGTIDSIDPNKPHTTGSVANLCKVAPRTVSKWCDSGRLKSYRIPGSEDRRIRHADLMAFVREHGIPVPQIEQKIFGYCSKEIAMSLKLDRHTTNSIEAGFVIGSELFAYYILEDVDGYSILPRALDLIESKCPYAKVVVLIDESVNQNSIVNSERVIHLIKPVTPYTIGVTLGCGMDKLYEQLPPAIE